MQGASASASAKAKAKASASAGAGAGAVQVQVQVQVQCSAVQVQKQKQVQVQKQTQEQEQARKGLIKSFKSSSAACKTRIPTGMTNKKVIGADLNQGFTRAEANARKAEAANATKVEAKDECNC